MTVFVTGGAGFIGSNFIFYYLEKPVEKNEFFEALADGEVEF